MIVSNTTPISNFLHLNRIDILRQMFEKIHIPPAVKQEIEVGFSGNIQWQQCLTDEFFAIRKTKSPALIHQILGQLHRGEAEVLCICLENKAKLCLLDDRDARHFAKRNQIPITGTLGILVEAKKRGHIESVKPLMNELKSFHHFWISSAMYTEVLNLSGEISQLSET
jgi:predicted nucleic acid-binding protein